jgi:hypothetical protein
MATNVKVTHRKVNDAPGNVVASTAVVDTQTHTQVRHTTDEPSTIERGKPRAGARSAM